MAFAKATRLTQDSRITSVGTRSFKVYTDSDKVKDETDASEFTRKSFIPVRRKSVSVTKQAISIITKDLKASSKDIGKGKGNYRSSENTKLGRKALADVSNLSGNSSRFNLGSDGTNLMKSKKEKIATVQRISVGPCARAMNISSRKSIVEKTSEKLSQGVGSTRTSRRDTKDSKSALDDQMTQGKNSRLASAASGTRTAERLLIPTRKSFPFLKRMNMAESSGLKNSAAGSEEAKVSSKVSRVNKKAIPRASCAGSYLRKNRTSDGFKLTNPARHGSLDVCPLQRKSIKIQTTVKTTLKNSNLQMKSKHLVGTSRPNSIAAISSKEEAATSSHPKNLASEVSNEHDQGELSSNEPTATTVDISVKKKSNRRRSFTSSLMARSKFLEGNCEAVEQEKLPSIDDECNQLEVAEYVDDIYHFYWVAEAQNPALGNYMSVQTEITPCMRGILINWLIEVHFKFDLMQETLYLTGNLLDRYLSQVPIKQNKMQLVGLSALLLASKYEDFWHPRIKDLISISAESYSREQILEMEKLMLKQIKFRLNAPTPYVFMLRFLKAAQSNKKLEHLAFYLTELCLVEYEALKFKSSLLCASAIYVARCTLHMTPAWTPLLVKHARYDMPQMRECAEMILGFQKAAKTGKLRVTYEKYMNPDLCSVAAIKPLNSLAG